MILALLHDARRRRGTRSADEHVVCLWRPLPRCGDFGKGWAWGRSAQFSARVVFAPQMRLPEWLLWRHAIFSALSTWSVVHLRRTRDVHKYEQLRRTLMSTNMNMFSRTYIVVLIISIFMGQALLAWGLIRPNPSPHVVRFRLEFQKFVRTLLRFFRVVARVPVWAWIRAIPEP